MSIVDAGRPTLQVRRGGVGPGGTEAWAGDVLGSRPAGGRRGATGESPHHLEWRPCPPTVTTGRA